MADSENEMRNERPGCSACDEPKRERDWRTMGIIELAVENQSVRDYIEHWEGRTLKAEAELQTSPPECPTCKSVLSLYRGVGGNNLVYSPSLPQRTNLCEDSWHEEAAISQSAGNAPRIYAGSRASVPERPAMWKRLRSNGAAIVASWIDEAEPGATADLSELWARIQREIKSSDRLILYVEASDFPLNGALVEVGMALGMGKEVWIVAPGVELEPRSLRPLGSWAKHPNVHFCTDINDAVRCSNFGAAPQPAGQPEPSKPMKLAVPIQPGEFSRKSPVAPEPAVQGDTLKGYLLPKPDYRAVSPSYADLQAQVARLQQHVCPEAALVAECRKYQAIIEEGDAEIDRLEAQVARWKALGADSPEAMAKLLVSQRLCAQLREQLLKDSEAEAEVARLREAETTLKEFRRRVGVWQNGKDSL
jgi:hypothetical protein